MKSPTHVSTFLRAVCGLVLAAWAFPTGFFSVLMISGRSFPLIITLLCNRIQLKVFYNLSFAEDRCEVITTDENQLSCCDDFMQIVRVLTGTWRNVITCAYLFHVSCSPRGLNSNTFLANSDCSACLWKNSLPVSVVLRWSHFTFIYNRSANMNYFIYISHKARESCCIFMTKWFCKCISI